jgi:hypothetical protein
VAVIDASADLRVEAFIGQISGECDVCTIAAAAARRVTTS